MTIFSTGFNNQGRVKNVLVNMKVSLICQVITTILSFVSRSVFISMLGKTYLGVNGIFSNILILLSLTELGFGSAVVYNLYKPLREKDEKSITSLLHFYKQVYYIIGVFIFLIGIFLIPFLKYIIKEQPDIKENIKILYVLHLIGTVSTYFFAHKLSLLKADQKSYIANIYSEIFRIIKIISQIIILITTHNYILYLVLQILFNFLTMFSVAKRIDKIYSFIKTIKPEPLSKKFKITLRKDVGALFLYRINHVVIHGTDNILIATLVKNGVQTVGLYSNYLMISETVNTLLSIITNNFTHSIGNLNAGEDRQRKEDIFYCLLLICAWLYGFVCTGIFVLSDNFISIWLGKEYILDITIVGAGVLLLYIRSVHFAAYTYRITCGLFVQSKYVPIFTSIINIILSIWWGKIWGLFGIIFATSIARIITIGIIDPILVYKYIFIKNPIYYYLKYFSYVIISIISALCATYLVYLINSNDWKGFIMKLILYSMIFNLIFLIFVYNMKEFQYIRNTAMSIIQRFI